MLVVRGIPMLEFPVTKNTLVLIGRGIKKGCIDRGMKQKELALFLNINSAYLSQLLTGARALSFQMMFAIADAFKQKLSDLLISSRPHQDQDQHLNALVEVALILEDCPEFFSRAQCS